MGRHLRYLFNDIAPNQSTQDCTPSDKECNLQRKCAPDDFACMSMTNPELYKYIVGNEPKCRDPPKCSKYGTYVSELLHPIYLRCNEEAKGDKNAFVACIMDIMDILKEGIQRF